VHAVHLEPEEIALLARLGCSVAHCPSSNLKLASGIAPVDRMLTAGINIGIGTDGAASNNRLDVFCEMRLAALLAKTTSDDAETLPAHMALRMATLNAAQALGLERRVGSIQPGKSADLCAVNLDSISLSPCYDPASHLVYAAGRKILKRSPRVPAESAPNCEPPLSVAVGLTDASHPSVRDRYWTRLAAIIQPG
jgi:5-methylthioadenosine/S-adenosylhomocysteine deaminase